MQTWIQVLRGITISNTIRKLNKIGKVFRQVLSRSTYEPRSTEILPIVEVI